MGVRGRDTSRELSAKRTVAVMKADSPTVRDERREGLPPSCPVREHPSPHWRLERCARGKVAEWISLTTVGG